MIAATFGARLRLGGLAIKGRANQCWLGFGWLTSYDPVETKASVGRWWGWAALGHIVYYLYRLWGLEASIDGELRFGCKR